MESILVILQIIACVFTIISNYENVEKTLMKAYAAIKRGKRFPLFSYV